MNAGFEIARLSTSGAANRRLLMVGDRRWVAPGDERSLSSAVVAAAAAAGGAGLDVDVLWDLAPALRAIGGRSAPWRLWRYDTVVVVVGGGAPGAALGRLQRLLNRVLADLADAGRLIVVLAAATSRRQSERASREGLQQLGDDLPPGVATILQADLDLEGDLHDPAAIAELVVGTAASPARPSVASARRSEPQDEPARQRAVDRSAGTLEHATTDLERVVLLASNSFEVPFAQVNLVDRGRLRSLAYVGRSSDALERSLSGLVVQRDGALMIPDTGRDPRCAEIPETRGPDAIRFYAGHPLESLDGYRIGVLCVLDVEPHPVEPGDEVLLRDIALLAEAELIALDRR